MWSDWNKTKQKLLDIEKIILIPLLLLSVVEIEIKR
jgi:hypothetical protein